MLFFDIGTIVVPYCDAWALLTHRHVSLLIHSCEPTQFLDRHDGWVLFIRFYEATQFLDRHDAWALLIHSYEPTQSRDRGALFLLF